MAGSGKRVFRIFIVVLLLAGGAGAYLAWKYALSPNVELGDKNYIYLKIPRGTDYEGLKTILTDEGIVKDVKTFDWLAKQMDLDKKVQPGKYRVNKGMNNRQLIKMLASGKDEKIKLTINYTTRNFDQLIEKLTSKFDMTEEEIRAFLNNEQRLDEEFGLNSRTIATLVRPGTYELSWATSAEDFFSMMKEEYKRIWTSENKQKAERMGKTQSEVMILASIVQGESNIASEQKKIAGVYLNRLEKNMALQADPTVIFALNDFSIQRVSSDDLKIDSPYNTYRYKGLPPGPVCFPTDQAVQSVLNHEKSNFLFFCAKPELNGYSDFACTYEEHLRYAKAYQDAMTKRGIRR